RGMVISVSDGEEEALLDPVDIEVLPADTEPNQPPEISGTPPGSVIVGSNYDFIPTASDADGDVLSFSIENRPAWASFDPQIGRLSGAPSSNDIGSYGNIIIRVGDGIAETALDQFTIVVNPLPQQNTAPTISGTPATSVLVGQAYSFTPSAGDADGDPLSFSIFNQPAWASFDSATGTLSGTPGIGAVGTHGGISIVVSDGEASASLPSFSITVVDPNNPPTISGSPSGSVVAGSAYAFTPTANDPDGDTLSFSITNAPSWASFNTRKGSLTGTPGTSHVGTYGSISITVSDGSASDTLGPFSIEVTAVPNDPPTISGSPAGSVVAGSAYAFTPTASDPDGDTLSFSISNAPSWASFNTANGALTGNPTGGHVGTYNNISITVSDGSLSDTLGPFSIQVLPNANGTATLTWTPPTENTDGSPLTDLAGYIVYWGTSPGNYSNSTTINNPGVTTYIVDNLLSGTTYYFVTTAFNSGDLESSFSNSGLALQDIVNEVARRLGFDVEPGRYRGKKGEIGFDGLWRSPEG
ncbi:MAG: putative Ig domain-containing protein, partial [Gammaproteobacteria bacterium]|nr:putative Ig domain-containing protein [Gammaproteobacteria bacterium]